MKKFIPLVSVLGITSLLVCANTSPKTNVHNDFAQDLASFAKSTDLNILDTLKNTQKNINNYAVKLNIPADATLVDSDTELINEPQIIPSTDDFTPIEIDDIEESQNLEENIEENETDNQSSIQDPDATIDNENKIETEIQDEIEDIEIENDSGTDKLLTIYSLSKDIEENCGKYCEIKNMLTDSILETQTLIEQIKANQIELNAEQRLLLNEQSNDLKRLGQELARNTNELNIYLKDINGYLTDENDDLDSVCLKYLLLLNNLTEGGNLMNTGLASLGMMNNIMRMSSQILPENNTARILYGFSRNNQPPTITQFDIDSNGNVTEKDLSNEKLNSTEEVNGDIEEENKTVDSYKNKKLKSNIDSYRNNYNNIDSFFNTALLDNELMFGNNGMNYGGGFYPMMYGGNFANYNSAYQNNFNDQNNYQNRTYGMNYDYNTQYNQQSKTQDKKKKSKKLKKNVDTYRDDTTPNPKQRFKNLKAKISNFFKGKDNDKIANLKNK